MTCQSFIVLHPELLLSFCPLVERLGFDENYVDITEMVERRLAQTPEPHVSFKGHIYNNSSKSHVCLVSGVLNLHHALENQERRYERS